MDDVKCTCTDCQWQGMQSELKKGEIEHGIYRPLYCPECGSIEIELEFYYDKGD